MPATLERTDTRLDALLAGILANPVDDIVRMIYADALEETGEPEDVARAEFIRLQIALAKLSHRPRELASREQKLQHDLRCKSWYQFGKNGGGLDRVSSITFRRGFIHTIRCSLRFWIGGPCPRLELENSWPDEPPYQAGKTHGIFDCRHCDSTGQVVSHGPRIVREHPVERVVVTDRSREVAMNALSDAAIRWAKSTR